MLKVAFDGEVLFSLEPGQIGTAVIDPGNFTLSVEIGALIFWENAKTQIHVERASHVQIQVDLETGFWGNKIAFNPVHFEGHYDYSE